MMWGITDMCSDTSSSDSDVLPGFFPIYCDLRGTMTDRKVYQAYKGQLKLSVYINYGLLTVHVMQARMLQSQTPGLCDAYIKLCLDPDTTNRTCCMTEVVHDSNNPLFDEKFSFELLEEDISKRLLISVWNRGAELCEDEVLGSMSFGIQHIQQHGQIVAGWYYLLMGDIGNRKHLRVQEKKVPSSGGSIPSVNTDIKWMEPHTFVLKRKRGFGFSLSGSCPVSVSKVEPGSTAATAGLEKGDCIVKIDGVNVSRSTADSIARIFRHADKHVVLEVHRPQHQTTPGDSGVVGWRPPLSDKEPNCMPQKIEKLNVSPWKPPNIRTSVMEEADDTMRNYGWLESADRLHIQSQGQRTALVRPLSTQCQQNRPLSVQCQQYGMHGQQNRPLGTHRQQSELLSIQCQHSELLSTQCQQYGTMKAKRQQSKPLTMRCQQNELLGTQCQKYSTMRTKHQPSECYQAQWEQTGSLGRTKLPSGCGRTLQGVSGHRDIPVGKTWYSHGKENKGVSTLPPRSMQHRKVSFMDF